MAFLSQILKMFTFQFITQRDSSRCSWAHQEPTPRLLLL